jgi:ribosomal protein S4
MATIINRRCRNLKNKKYRKFNADIWSRLAIKRRYNFITRLISDAARVSVSRQLRRVSKKTRRRVWANFNKKGKKTKKKKFTYQTDTLAIKKFNRRSSRRGGLLKLRRQISLFYGGGRIRVKTYRRYSKMITEKTTYRPHIPNKHKTLVYHTGHTFASFMESRLDVLILRSNFVDSIYKARNYIFHRKCKVQGQTRVNHPGYLVKNFQLYHFNKNYARIIKKNLRLRIRNKRIIAIPSYLYVNFSCMLAFKMQEPNTKTITYPFTDKKGALALFRQAYAKL